MDLKAGWQGEGDSGAGGSSLALVCYLDLRSVQGCDNRIVNLAHSFGTILFLPEVGHLMNRGINPSLFLLGDLPQISA